MGKSLEHKMLQGLVFFMRGRIGRIGRVGLVGGPLEEGGFSDWSDWSENLLRRTGPLKRLSLRKKKNPAPLGGGGAGLSYFFSAGLRLRFRA